MFVVLQEITLTQDDHSEFVKAIRTIVLCYRFHASTIFSCFLFFSTCPSLFSSLPSYLYVPGLFVLLLEYHCDRESFSLTTI